MKPGLNSSEFWLVAAYMLVMLANGTQFFDIPWEHVLAMGGVVGVYNIGRTAVKMKRGDE